MKITVETKCNKDICVVSYLITVLFVEEAVRKTLNELSNKDEKLCNQDMGGIYSRRGQSQILKTWVKFYKIEFINKKGFRGATVARKPNTLEVARSTLAGINSIS